MGRAALAQLQRWLGSPFLLWWCGMCSLPSFFLVKELQYSLHGSLSYRGSSCCLLCKTTIYETGNDMVLAGAWHAGMEIAFWVPPWCRVPVFDRRDMMGLAGVLHAGMEIVLYVPPWCRAPALCVLYRWDMCPNALLPATQFWAALASYNSYFMYRQLANALCCVTASW